jgi:hypothetical protein
MIEDDRTEADSDAPKMTARLAKLCHPPTPVLLLLVSPLAWLACSDSSTTGPDEESLDGADRTPPHAVADLAFAYPGPGGSAVLSWTAPRDEGGASSDVDRYEIRYAFSSPFEWENALPVSDPPAPAPAGEHQSYEFTDPRRGRDLYAAVRCFDRNDNPSAVGNVAHVHIAGSSIEGRCVDVLTGAAVQGLYVQVTDRLVRTAESDENGRYRFDDLAAGMANVSLRSGTAERPYHGYNRSLELVADQSWDHFMVAYAPTELPAGHNVLSLMLEAVGYNNYRRILKKWRTFPIDVFVPPFSNSSGLDYEAVCRGAVDEWNERVGLALFRLVGAQPETGVWFQFKTRQEMSPQIGVTHHENDASGYPKTSDISIVDDFVDGEQLRKVALHELGHTIRLGHLPQGYLMYGGQPLPATVSNDEVMVVELYLAFPNGTDLSVYDPSAPE